MLRRSGSKGRDVHVVWDEDNLKQNEEIQKEYSGVRIQEPKTPYRPPLPSDSLEEDMKPLQLDEVASALRPDRMTAFDYVMSNGGAAFDGAGSSQQQQQQQEQPQQQQEQQEQPHQPPAQPAAAAAAAATSNASSEADGDKVMQDALGDKRSEPCTSFTSSGSEGSADKRRKFEQMRKQHYNMRDALVKAKQLMDTEDEDDGPNVEEEEDEDTANCQNGMAADPDRQHSTRGERQPRQQQQQQQRGEATDAVS